MVGSEVLSGVFGRFVSSFSFFFLLFLWIGMAFIAVRITLCLARVE